MIDKCLPALIASALFFALIMWDVVSRRYTQLPGRLLFGLFTILVFLVLCSKGLEYIGWAILMLPVVLITAGYLSTKSWNFAPVTATPLTGCDIPTNPTPETGCSVTTASTPAPACISVSAPMPLCAPVVEEC